MVKITGKILEIIILLTITSVATNGQTNVSGGIYTNTTWTLANSPYIVVDTVVVFPNVILTIEPGVVIRFNSNRQIEVRQGRIIAEGTNTDSITFTSNSFSPYVGAWAGIYLNHSQYSKFNYCNFIYADKGISPFYMYDTLTVKNSNFIYNTIGVGFMYYSWVFVDSCKFRLNTNGLKGYVAGRLTVNNCNISSNQNGIVEIENATIKNCIVDSNTGIGIESHQNDTVMNCLVRHNGIGMKINPSGAFGGLPQLITKNIIEYNTIGIELNAPTNTIICNKICNNTTYEFKYLFSYPGNTAISGNYWCTTDSLTIASGIYDGYDDASLNLISFMPIDTLQCYLATGMNEIENHFFNLTIFPNPVVDHLTLVVPLNNSMAELKIFNVLGELVFNSMIAQTKILIDVSALADGIYIIEVVAGNTISRRKFIRQ